MATVTGSPASAGCGDNKATRCRCRWNSAGRASRVRSNRGAPARWRAVGAGVRRRHRLPAVGLAAARAIHAGRGRLVRQRVPGDGAGQRRRRVAGRLQRHHRAPDAGRRIERQSAAIDDRLRGSKLTAIAEDHAGRLWVVANSSLLRIGDDTVDEWTREDAARPDAGGHRRTPARGRGWQRVAARARQRRRRATPRRRQAAACCSTCAPATTAASAWPMPSNSTSRPTARRGSRTPPACAA